MMIKFKDIRDLLHSMYFCIYLLNEKELTDYPPLIWEGYCLEECPHRWDNDEVWIIEGGECEHGDSLYITLKWGCKNDISRNVN